MIDREAEMKRFRIKQTAATPIFLLCMILCIEILSTKGKQQEITNVPTYNSTNTNESIPVVEDVKEDAELALETGTNIGKEITDAYAEEIIERVRNRKVVASDTKNLQRESEETLFTQSFDWMSGYQNLVQLEAMEPVEQSLEIHTEISEVVVVMLFPDQSYVTLKPNEPITLRVPTGRSTIIYVGKEIGGRIEAKIKKNDKVTYHRM